MKDPELAGSIFPVALHPDAQRLMTGAVGVVARLVIRQVVAERREGLPVALLEVHAGVEPYVEDWQEAVIRVQVLLPATEAIAAWDRIARRVEAVRATLDSLQQEILDESIALELCWREDGSNGPP